MRKLRTRAWVAVLVLLAPLGAVAAEVDWSNTAGGVWSVGTNWDGGDPPGALDAALFNRDQSPAYTVSLGDDEVVGRLQVLNDIVTLDLGGHDLDLYLNWAGTDWYNDNTFDVVAPLMVGRGTSTEGHTGTLVIQGGGTVRGDGLLVGASSTSTGILKVQGVGTTLAIDNVDQVHAIFGARGNGELQVLGGATASFTSGVRFGRRSTAGTQGTLLVEGAVQIGETLHRSTLNWGNGGLHIGHLNDAYATIRDGALAIGSGTSIVSSGSRPAGLTIDNAILHQTSGQIRVGSGSGEATVDVRNGGLLKVDAIFYVGQGIGATGYLTITGNQSRVEVNGNHTYFGGTTSLDQATSHVTIADSGTADFGRMLRMYSRANLYLDGGTMTASAIDVREGAQVTLTLHTGEFGPAIRSLNRTATEVGNVSLNSMGFTLDLAAGFTADLEDVFTVLRYEGALTGTFLGLAEGAVLSQDSFDFELSYGGGTNSAITLTVIPEPATLGLLLAAGGLLALRRRTRG